MTVEYQNSESDFFQFIRLHQKKRLQKYLFPLAVAALIAGMSFNNQGSPTLLRLVIASLLSFFVLCACLYYIPVFRASAKLKQRLHSQPAFRERKKISLQNDGLLFESESKQVLLRWKEIVQVQSFDAYLYLLLLSNSFLLVPAKSFGSEQDFTNFHASILRGTVWGTTDPAQRWEEVRPKPPYLMGLLCFIPLIGAFFGLSFIISGITRYKDRWFTLIGVFGVVFTIGIYTILFQENKKRRLNNPSSTEQIPALPLGDVGDQDSVPKN